MKKPEYKFVEVTWADANSGTGWLRIGDPTRDLPSSCACVTRGWLIREDANAVVLAGTMGLPEGAEHEAEFNQVIAIPRGMVIKKREMKYA